MKNTWEEKAKISEEYERDRQQLLIDQQVAARQLEAARERNWALLEQKGDLVLHIYSLPITSIMMFYCFVGNIIESCERLSEEFV